MSSPVRTAALGCAVLASTLIGVAAGYPPAAVAGAGPSSPAIVEAVQLGDSVLGRPIVAYRLGDPTAQRKVVLLGQMHGDEHAGVIVADSLLAGPPLAGVDLWVVPTMNPDGDAAHTRLNAHGVDLNRNWPDAWTPVTGNFNPGPAALSEPETRAMYGLLRRVQPDYLLSIHQPLDGVDTTDGGARDPGLAARLAANLGLALKPFRCWSVCTGSMTGWLTDNQHGVAETIEFPAGISVDYLQSVAPWALLSAVPGVRHANALERSPRATVAVNMLLPATPNQPAGVGHTGSVVRLAGTAWDPDNPSGQLSVSIREGNRTVATNRTVKSSVQLNARFRLTGTHGYLVQFLAPPGRHHYCVVSANVGMGARHSPSPCVNVTVDGRPYGAVDQPVVVDGTLSIQGWALDPNRSGEASAVTVTLDSQPVTGSVTYSLRPDVSAAYRVPNAVGFRVTMPAPAPGEHVICVSADSALAVVPATQLNCQTVSVA